jgi:hypothetical protein
MAARSNDSPTRVRSAADCAARVAQGHLTTFRDDLDRIAMSSELAKIF